MTRITITPRSEEALPFLVKLLSNNELVADFSMKEEDADTELSADVLEAIAEVERGEVYHIGDYDAYLKWMKELEAEAKQESKEEVAHEYV
jgi:hypothetical protein